MPYESKEDEKLYKLNWNCVLETSCLTDFYIVFIVFQYSLMLSRCQIVIKGIDVKNAEKNSSHMLLLVEWN